MWTHLSLCCTCRSYKRKIKIDLISVYANVAFLSFIETFQAGKMYNYMQLFHLNWKLNKLIFSWEVFSVLCSPYIVFWCQPQPQFTLWRDLPSRTVSCKAKKCKFCTTNFVFAFSSVKNLSQTWMTVFHSHRQVESIVLKLLCVLLGI